MEQEQDQRHHLLLRLATDALYWLVRIADFQPLECGLGILMAVWAIVLLWPGDLFAVSPRVYVIMAARGTDTSWGLWATGVVLCHVAGAIGTIVFPCSGRWALARMAGVLLTGGWFVYLGCMFAGAGIVSFGAFSHFILAGLSAWTLWRYVARPCHDE